LQDLQQQLDTAQASAKLAAALDKEIKGLSQSANDVGKTADAYKSAYPQLEAGLEAAEKAADLLRGIVTAQLDSKVVAAIQKEVGDYDAQVDQAYTDLKNKQDEYNAANDALTQATATWQQKSADLQQLKGTQKDVEGQVRAVKDLEAKAEDFNKGQNYTAALAYLQASVLTKDDHKVKLPSPDDLANQLYGKWWELKQAAEDKRAKEADLATKQQPLTDAKAKVKLLEDGRLKQYLAIAQKHAKPPDGGAGTTAA
jgi:hypothetical protein